MDSLHTEAGIEPRRPTRASERYLTPRDTPCPFCDKTVRGRTGLEDHCRAKHGRTLDVVRALEIAVAFIDAALAGDGKAGADCALVPNGSYKLSDARAALAAIRRKD